LVTVTKTGAAGNLFLAIAVVYRLIVT